LVNKGKLGRRRGAQHKGIEIVQPHAAIERIDREGQRKPSLDQATDVGIARMEIEHRAGALGHLGTDREAGDVRGFQRVDRMEIVRPGLGKIFPGV
jgi:hypothetical protein